MQQLLQQLLVETAHAANECFPGKPLRIWYIKLGEHSWKCIIFNTASKIRLAEGPKRATGKAAILAMKNQLKAEIRKTY